MKNKLDAILSSLLHQKQQYQKQIQITFSNLKSQYISNLQQKDKLIYQLQSTIKSLRENCKQLQERYASKLEVKQQQITMLRLVLKKKYLEQLSLQQNIKRYEKKQKTQELIRMSYENIQSLISIKQKHEPSKKNNISAFTKKSFEKDTQKTQETIVKHKIDSIPTSTIKKKHMKSSSILGINDLKKHLSQNYISNNLIKCSFVSADKNTRQY